jgi:predicted nucleic acid-binding protein
MGSRRVKAAYIDASALVKLFKAEPETAAFRVALGEWPVRVASELIRVEAICTARRVGGKDVLARANAALERIILVPMSRKIIELAGAEHTRPLRALDAIHLATALTLHEDLGAVFVYDTDLHAAANAHGLNPLSPTPA